MVHTAGQANGGAQYAPGKLYMEGERGEQMQGEGGRLAAIVHGGWGGGCPVIKHLNALVPRGGSMRRGRDEEKRSVRAWASAYSSNVCACACTRLT